MKQSIGILLCVLGYLTLGVLPAEACKFTPLEWQRRVEKHSIPGLVGQRKHTTWIRDRNRNFVDDEIEKRFRPGELVDVIVDLNECVTPVNIERRLSEFGRIRYIGKLVTFVLLDDVRVQKLKALAAQPYVAMVEWQTPVQFVNDVSTRSIQARASNTFSPNTAQDAGFNGAGVTIAIVDSGVDEGHETFAGKFVAGFNSTIFEDTNGNGIDDSCEPAPLGNGVCTDADDEPGNGTTNPPDDVSHGTHVAGIALGAGAAGRVCSPPDDGSPTNCAGAASGAQLVDIKVGGAAGIQPSDITESIDWLGINAGTFNIQAANMSFGGCLDDDGTSANAQQVNYVVSLGVLIAVAHGNASNCFVAPGTTLTTSPGSASFAITVGGTDDRNTVARNDDTIFSQFLIGPRMDFNLATPNLLALKPDIAAPGENIFSAQQGTVSSYFSQSGTSMASPHVAGAIAIIRQAQPTIDPGSLKDLLKQNADTTLNVAAFPAVDPNWDTAFGSGMLNVWAALNAAAATDPGFPNCVGPPAAPGQPCDLTPPLPRWNNNLDISTAAAPQVGVANTITAQVRNNGPVAAIIKVNFGVYVFAVGNNQFFHVGTQQVTIPAGSTVAVNQPWTPAAANHQCVQISIDFGLDTNFGNNVTQRNLNVAPSVFTVRVENPFMVPARFQIKAVSDQKGWMCRVSKDSFTIDPMQDCPQEVRVVFNAPRGTRPGERANCDVAVYGLPEGAKEPRLIGGVTVQTFVPRPCRTVGMVLDNKRRPVRNARLAFFRQTVEELLQDRKTTAQRQRRAPRGRPATASTDRDGIFSVTLTPHVKYTVTINEPRVGEGELVIRPTCGVGNLRFVLGREGVKLLERQIVKVVEQ